MFLLSPTVSTLNHFGVAAKWSDEGIHVYHFWQSDRDKPIIQQLVRHRYNVVALAVIVVLGVSVMLYELIGLFRHVRKAKSTGLPYTISPHHEFETIAYVTTPILRVICMRHT